MFRPQIARMSEFAPPDRAPRDSWLKWSGAALLAPAAALLAGCAFPAPPGRATGDMIALGIEHRPYRVRVRDKLSVRF